jgi:hypothetical protein
MRHTNISILALAVLLYSAPVFAQHGHGGGMGGATGTHGNMGSANHASANGSSATLADQQKIDNILKKNSAISGKLQTLTGMPAQQACTGFKNLGQCVAAAHVSKNLGISFACLRADMTGQAPPAGSSCPAGTAASSKSPMSLGKAIQTLSPNANSKLEAKRAQKQADRDIKDSGSNS